MGLEIGFEGVVVFFTTRFVVADCCESRISFGITNPVDGKYIESLVWGWTKLLFVVGFGSYGVGTIVLTAGMVEID